MMQKVAWKAKKTRCGIVVPSRGSKVTSCRATWPRPPIEVAGPVERERIADQRPRDGRDRDRGDAHHERVERVLRAHEARVEEPEPERHHQDERGRGEHPGRVARVDLGGLREDQDVHHAPTGVTARSSVSPRADADHPLQRHDEDLAVADLAGPTALAEGIDRRLDERIGDRDLEADLVGEPDLHGRAAVGLDPVELTAVALDPADREPAHVGAVEGLQHVVRLLRPDDADHEFHSPAPL